MGETVVTVMVQGLMAPPWVVSAKLTDLGFGADVRTRLRPAVMGNLVHVELKTWRGDDVVEHLAAGTPEAVAALARFLRFMAKLAYGVQFAVHKPGREWVAHSCEVAPGQIGRILPEFMAHRDGMAFIYPTRARELYRRYPQS